MKKLSVYVLLVLIGVVVRGEAQSLRPYDDFSNASLFTLRKFWQ